jgi:hypothetical protein
MAHIDFGRAFSTPDNNLPSTSASAAEQQADLAPAASGKDNRRFRAFAKFGRAESLNLIFATVTFIGGLFCAFYLFNGGEVWRAAAAWPRELLYRRPAAVMATIDASQSAEHGILPHKDSLAPADHTGDPFSRTSGFLSLASPATLRPSGIGGGLPATALESMTRSPFAQLGFAPPGGDALKQAFDGAVAQLSRSLHAEAARTVVVLETTDMKVQRRNSAKARPAAKRVVRAVRNPLQEQARARSAAEPAVNPQNVVNSAGNFSNNTVQQVLNSTGSASLPVSSGVGPALGHVPISLGGRH